MADYNNYLIYILTQMRNQEEGVRAMAGLLLKNNIRNHYDEFHHEVKNYIKESCIASLGDSHQLVRSTIGTVVTTLCSKGLSEWGSLLPALYNLLAHPDGQVVEGALGAICKVCEDCAQDMESPQLAGTLEALIPRVLTFVDSPNEKLRFYAIQSLNQFVPSKPQALITHLNQYIQSLYNHATDASSAVRQAVCHGLVLLLEVRPDDLMPQIGTIAEFMLHSTQDQDENVALEACEFWLAFPEQPNSYEILLPLLPRLIPVLIHRMVYSELDIDVLRGNEDDYHVPDRSEDIKPKILKGKQKQAQHITNPEVRFYFHCF